MTHLSYNPDVLDALANLSNDEVFTPPKLVNQMLDLLPISLWGDSTATFLDPATKSGVFLREIVKRLNVGLEQEIPDLQERLNHILTKQVFGIAITSLTGLLARRSLYCSKFADGTYSLCTVFDNPDGQVRFEKIEHNRQSGKCNQCGASESEYRRADDLENHGYEFIHRDARDILSLFTNDNDMKFDVIIGNPPYQLSDGGAQASAMPLYHKFVQQAKKLNPRYLSMIIPARWYSGGKGLDSFRDEMLHDDRIRELHDFLDAGEVFPGVEIKGGVCFFMRNRDNKGNCTVMTHEKDVVISTMERPLLEEENITFIRYNEAIPILSKVKKFKEKTIDTQISSQKPFGLRTFFQGKKSFFDGSIKVYANKNVGYIDKNVITQNQNWINKHKIIVPRAIGSGDSKSDIIKPIYAGSGTCCTETYVVIGPYNSQEEADNVVSYIQTKFFHFMVTLKKNTMMAPKNVYSFVPLQDFSESWSDEKLYQKYNLSQEEIEFIESMTPNF